MIIFGQPGLGKSLLIHEIINKISNNLSLENDLKFQKDF